jgi:riboflavin kinase/FMN adenylyltransferase
MRHIATIGFFDGVHRGHQFLFSRLRDEADKRGLDPLIITFCEHPRAVLQMGFQPRLLSSKEERLSRLKHYANAEVFDFQAIHSQTAQQFMQTLHEQYEVDALLVGYDHRFGSDRITDLEQLKMQGRAVGVEVVRAEEYNPTETTDAHISSTEIRNALAAGEIERANELLGYTYTLSGTVVHGRGIGRTIGFPTANIQMDEPRKLLPPPGVYVAEADLGNGHQQPAILNIGTNPTLGENPITIELHIPNLELDLYGRQLHIRLLHYLRPERRFDSLEELRKQIEADIQSAF